MIYSLAYHMVNTWANWNKPDKMRENVKNLKKAKYINSIE